MSFKLGFNKLNRLKYACYSLVLRWKDFPMNSLVILEYDPIGKIFSFYPKPKPKTIVLKIGPVINLVKTLGHCVPF